MLFPDRSLVTQGESRRIAFLPTVAGQIHIQSSVPNPPIKSEIGHIGRLSIFGPGARKPAATQVWPLGQKQAQVTFQATTNEILTDPRLGSKLRGEWTCEIVNDSDFPLTFTTQIDSPGDVPLITASFDVDLLNALLRSLIRMVGLKLNINSSPPGDPSVVEKQTTLEVSTVVASALKIPPSSPHHVDDFTKTIPIIHKDLTFRIQHLALEPSSVAMNFDTDKLRFGLFALLGGGKLVSQNTGIPDASLDSISVHVYAGLDGSLEAQGTAHVDVATVDLNVDIGQKIMEILKDRARPKDDPTSLSPFELTLPQALRERFKSFFVSLMRLGSDARILDFQVSGRSLVVRYYQVPVSKPPILTQ